MLTAGVDLYVVCDSVTYPRPEDNVAPALYNGPHTVAVTYRVFNYAGNMATFTGYRVVLRASAHNWTVTHDSGYLESIGDEKERTALVTHRWTNAYFETGDNLTITLVVLERGVEGHGPTASFFTDYSLQFESIAVTREGGMQDVLVTTKVENPEEYLAWAASEYCAGSGDGTCLPRCRDCDSRWPKYLALGEDVGHNATAGVGTGPYNDARMPWRTLNSYLRWRGSPCVVPENGPWYTTDNVAIGQGQLSYAETFGALVVAVTIDDGARRSLFVDADDYLRSEKKGVVVGFASVRLPYAWCN